MTEPRPSSHRDLSSVYASRFAERDIARRTAVWRELVRFLQRFVPDHAVVLDLGCDRGGFINHVRAAERWAVDVRDVRSSLGADVRFVQVDGLLADTVLNPGSFDLVFMSNYLEHLASMDQVLDQLQVVARLLKPGGRAMILQPNIRLVGGHYWDYVDHRTALTERSLEEAGNIAGLRTVKQIVRFFPFTTKARVPQWPWLVRVYLALPILWLVLGRQTLHIAERRGPEVGPNMART